MLQRQIAGRGCRKRSLQVAATWPASLREYGPDRICGAVDYVYNMATYEVTAGQYCKFLYAVAARDQHGLYSTSMDSLSFGCQITRNGTDGNYTYDFSGRPSGTEADWVNRPVNFVSWGDGRHRANGRRA